MQDNILTMILAGGQGTRLYPLTKDRSKPAVPFGGRYRIIDFVLNNFINSGLYKIKILTQFKSDSLNTHISRGWPVTPILGQFIDLVPAQMRTGLDWYKGTADAIHQNINQIHDHNPDHVCVFGGDHIYKMDIRQMLDFHFQKYADITISAVPVPVAQAHQFGVIIVDDDFRVIGFQEKPKENPATIPGEPDMVLASMGNYIFRRDTILEEVCDDAECDDSEHDFGKNILTKCYEYRRVYVYDFRKNVILNQNPEEVGYWRDVGTIDSYWQANMDLVSIKPIFNLYNTSWPLRTFVYNSPPAKFVWAESGRMGMATDSLVSEGTIISGGQINKSILSPNVRVNSFSFINESIIFEGCNIGRHSEIRRAIIDKYINIPPYTRIGCDHEEDRARGFTVSENGVVVVSKGTLF
ncbi:MAG: glucose-1-phosphate adenylyltransferase [Cyanobacteriota bacterium]